MSMPENGRSPSGLLPDRWGSIGEVRTYTDRPQSLPHRGVAGHATPTESPEPGGSLLVNVNHESVPQSPAAAGSEETVR